MDLQASEKSFAHLLTRPESSRVSVCSQNNAISRVYLPPMPLSRYPDLSHTHNPPQSWLKSCIKSRALNQLLSTLTACSRSSASQRSLRVRSPVTVGCPSLTGFAKPWSATRKSPLLLHLRSRRPSSRPASCGTHWQTCPSSGWGVYFVDQFGLQIAFAAAAPKKGGWRQPGMWTWKAKFFKPPSLVSVPAMASFIMANESSACTLDRSGLAILLGATQTARKLVCATQCHSNGREWPRSDLF